MARLFRVNARSSCSALDGRIETEAAFAPLAVDRTVKQSSESRRFPRSRSYRTQKLQLTSRDGSGADEICQAKLWDFSEGGLGMDSPRSFETGALLDIDAELLGPAYSIGLKARARVVYCRRIDTKVYRVGVAFIDIAYRPVADPVETNGSS